MAAEQGRSERAARLLGADHAVREPIGLAMHGSQRVAYERTVAATRLALGEERFAATWVQGKR